MSACMTIEDMTWCCWDRFTAVGSSGPRGPDVRTVATRARGICAVKLGDALSVLSSWQMGREQIQEMTEGAGSTQTTTWY